MLAAQRAYGPHDQHQDSLGPTAFGRALFRTLPEDRFDRQPLIDPSRRWLMVADVRLDNRAELLALLGQPAIAQFSDSEILFQLWVQRHEAELDLRVRLLEIRPHVGQAPAVARAFGAQSTHQRQSP